MDRVEQGILDSVAVIDEALMEMRRILSQDSGMPVASPVVTIDEVAEWLIGDEEWREEVKDLVFGLLAEEIAGEEGLLYSEERNREIVDHHNVHQHLFCFSTHRRHSHAKVAL